MREISVIKDTSFLDKLVKSNLKTYFVKILVLDKNENPIRPIEGRITGGSITISGNATIRRAGNLSFIAEEKENDLSDIENIISQNSKIKILMGFENNIDSSYDDVIWFNLGIFVISSLSFSHGLDNFSISLQLKDKMCLLNGDCGGNLPASVTFDSYEQIMGLSEENSFPQYPNNYTVYKVNGKYYTWDAETAWIEITENEANKLISSFVTVKQTLFDIIQTAVANYGGEDLNKIIINDVPREIKNIVRYTGSNPLYYNSRTDIYTLDKEYTTLGQGEWITYEYNEDCGHTYTELVYPGELISGLGETVTSVLDKIVSTLGNYEYFYDVNGNFVFQEKKNYLNTSYEPIQTLDKKISLALPGEDKESAIITSENYYVDLDNFSKSIYAFEEGSSLISSYSNSPKYEDIKNDFHIWGGIEPGVPAIHYHLAIKEKPQVSSVWEVVFNDDGSLRLAFDYDDKAKVVEYTPSDWRVELYLRGLEKKKLGLRPDIYEQELLDLFDTIYDFKERKYKADIVNKPNELRYWIDFINSPELFDISVDVLGPRIHAHQQEKIKKLYNTDVPDVILINKNSPVSSRSSIIQKCNAEGQQYANISQNIYNNLSLGTVGYSAEDVIRDLLYQYTDYNESISITSVPIYYLDVNKRISVYDRQSGIYGDYIINSINLPLDARNTMSISATRALQRV